MRETLPNDNWYEVRTIKKMLSGLASDGDIIDLRALTDGVTWGDALVLTAPSEIAIDGNTRSFNSSSTPLGDDKYQINVNTLSASIGDQVLFHNWNRTFDSQDGDEHFIEYETLESCIYFSVSGQINTETYREVPSNGSIVISIRETIVNTGVVSSWFNIFNGSYTKNYSDILNFNKIYDTDTKIELKTDIYTGAGYDAGSQGGYSGPLIGSVNISYSKSDEIIESVLGGKATWMASEV